MNISMVSKEANQHIMQYLTYILIIKAVESREKSCSVFLDFAKAFGTVNHDILLEKLKYYGIRGLPLN